MPERTSGALPDRSRALCDPDIERELASPTWSAHQHDTYRRLRESAPICWSPARREWLVSTFDLVDLVLGQPNVFSSVGEEAAHIRSQPAPVRALAETVADHFGGLQLNISDPPEHGRLRRGFNRPFVPRRVEGSESRIEVIARELIDDAMAKGSPVDAIASLAAPLPVRVIAEFIGIGRQHLDAITRVTLGQRYFFGEPEPGPVVTAEFEREVAWWRSLLRSAIEERRRTASDDVLSAVAGLVDDGEVSMDEAIATCLHLVIAGNSTTTALIGNVLALVLGDPDQREIVVDRPESIAAAVEEALRYEPPLPTVRRVATAAFAVGGQHIEPGDTVCCVLAAAGRDPAAFDRPDEFDVTRPITLRQQVAFGRGVHICLGAPLARLEAIVALRSVLERLPGVEVASGHRPQWHEVPTHRSLTTLPLVMRQHSS